MVINASGKVGIGIISPDYKLDVSSVIAISNPVSIVNQESELVFQTYSSNWDIGKMSLNLFYRTRLQAQADWISLWLMQQLLELI